MGTENGTPKAWYIDVRKSLPEARLAFLRTEIYRGKIGLLVRRNSAYDASQSDADLLVDLA